ncbi:MAG: pyruvate kinase [Hyphomicrobiaceae bacterium]|nr:pyruvate kinase [Hyphomicrobiaceae bacterium]
MRRNRRVKLIATLGPASSPPEMMERLFLAGVDVFRVNMSHASHELARNLVFNVRTLSKKYGCPIGILADLQGPKFRLGEFGGGRVMVPSGSHFTFDRDEVGGTQDRVFLPHPQIFEAVEPGHMLLLDDGKLRMRVLEARSDRISAEVVVGGPLASRKGISLPDTILPVGPLTEKDQSDLNCAIDLGADWIALSFVQRGQDVEDARKLITTDTAVMVKVEKPSAIDDLEAIVAAADGFMVARGDLGVEMPVERVPGLQKRITRMARAAGKPVVVATQMLESMITSPVPTRAEVSDVATAVFDGADAVMLSAESAVGQYPVEAIQMMDRIAIQVESDPSYSSLVHATEVQSQPTAHDAIAAAASAVADTVKLAAIVCFTATGSTALRVARERPGLPVIGLTPVHATAQRLTIVWGIHAILTSDPDRIQDMVNKACKLSMEHGFVKPGDGILVTAGVPFGSAGTTNMIRIAYVDESGTAYGDG